MDYDTCINWLYSQIPNYQKNGDKDYKPGLVTIKKLMKYYGNPHLNFHSIHIGGTNGKGSVSHMVASILQENGYQVGLFTSPHLMCFTERIKINGEKCSKKFIHENILKFKKSSIKFSFFELTTAFAFEYFSQKKVDFAVIEVGLGGRLDATNIIVPKISAITSINFDHEKLLGNTLIKIAFEKSGIIKPSVPIVIGEKKKELINFFSSISKKLNSKLIIPNYCFLSTDLKGNYQVQNQNTALGIIYELKLMGFQINNDKIKKGLINVIKNTKLRGRWEILSKKPLIICDTAHNPIGIEFVFNQLISLNTPLICLLGFIKGKNINKIISLLPKNIDYIFTKPTVKKGLNPQNYEHFLIEYNLHYIIINDIYVAFSEAKKKYIYQKILFIGGSTFVVADILKKYYKKNFVL